MKSRNKKRKKKKEGKIVGTMARKREESLDVISWYLQQGWDGDAHLSARGKVVRSLLRALSTKEMMHHRHR